MKKRKEKEQQKYVSRNVFETGVIECSIANPKFSFSLDWFFGKLAGTRVLQDVVSVFSKEKELSLIWRKICELIISFHNMKAHWDYSISVGGQNGEFMNFKKTIDMGFKKKKKKVVQVLSRRGFDHFFDNLTKLTLFFSI